jgi:hypothetical protein
MSTMANDPAATRATTAASASAFRTATIVGTVLQLAMVISGHWVEFIKLNVFAIGGTLISLIAAVIYARRARVERSRSAIQGALVGGLCALIGIGVSFLLGDVTASIFLIGTASSAIAGAIGGAIAGGAR